MVKGAEVVGRNAITGCLQSSERVQGISPFEGWCREYIKMIKETAP